MRFGESVGPGMDMHAAREALREERNRQMRVLQDDDRRRGILAGGSATLSQPSDSDAWPRRRVVSGAAQVIAPRDASFDDTALADGGDTLLCVITIVSAVNPSRSWTMPATSRLWTQLEQQALVPHTEPPVPLHRTVIATATHTQRTLPLISEYVRDVMLACSDLTTCILAGAQVLHSDRVFWTTWDPAVPVDVAEREAANTAASEQPYEPNLPLPTLAFPGELLQPAPALVGRQWPSQAGAPRSAAARPGVDDEDDI